MALKRREEDNKEYIYDVYRSGDESILRLKDASILYTDKMDGVIGCIPVQLKIDGRGRCTAQSYDMVSDPEVVKAALKQFDDLPFAYLKAFRFTQSVIAAAKMLKSHDDFFSSPKKNHACMQVVDRQGRRRVLDLSQALKDPSMFRQVDWVRTYKRFNSNTQELRFFTREYYDRVKKGGKKEEEKLFSLSGFGDVKVRGLSHEKPPVFTMSVSVIGDQEEELKKKKKVPYILTIEEKKEDIHGLTKSVRQLELMKGSRVKEGRSERL